MSDYNKLNIKFSNYGLNLQHDPITIPFGKYALLTNLVTAQEGQLQARPGSTRLTNLSSVDGTTIGVMRKLNDSVRGLSTYIARVGTKVDYTVTSTGAAGTNTVSTTTSPLFWRSRDVGYPSTGYSSSFGNICIDRTSRSNQVWAYIGDTTQIKKLGINASSLCDVKNVGITRPTGPPTFTQTTAGNLTLLSTYYYRYTLYDNNTGVESKWPSAEDPAVLSTNVDASITLTGANNQVGVIIPTETVDASTTHVRIYRKGGALNTWNFVAKAAYTGTTITYNDTMSDIALSSSFLLDEASDKPFTTTNSSGDDVAGQPLPYLFGPVNGYMLACGDATNPGYAYWCNKFNPDQQDPDNRVEVTSPQDPLVNGFTYDGKAFCFSKEGLYELVLGLSSSTWTPFKTSCGHGLAAPHAFVTGPEIYFLGKDGIYATGGGVERSLTNNDLRPLFEGTSVYGLSPVSYATADLPFHFMVYHKNQLWFQYKAVNGTVYALVYDLLYNRWRYNQWRIGLGCMYDDEEGQSRLLIGSNNGFLSLHSGTLDEGGIPNTIPVELTTGIITLGAPLIHKEWGALIMDINPNNVSVTVSVYTNKGTTQIATATWSDGTRSRKFLSLGDTNAEDIQIDISWAANSTSPILYGYELLYRPDVVQLSRWSVTSVSHGIQGWQILRSGYITLVSDGTVNLSITADGGTTYTYSIASTAGAKKKVFIPFDPIKGKLFTYVLSLNSATYFRLYNKECEMQVKPWVSSIGYLRANPFLGNDDGEIMGNSTAGSDSRNYAGPGLGSGAGGSSGSVGQSSAGTTLLDAFNFLGQGGQPLSPPVNPPDAPDNGDRSGNGDGNVQDLTYLFGGSNAPQGSPENGVINDPGRIL